MSRRSIVIDTDTASDDAVALVLAVREPSVDVRAVTVVAGNVPLDLAVRNAIVTLDLAGEPPVAYARPRRHPAFAGLTRREREVAKLIASGYTNQQLAEALYISLANVKDHVHSILSKTGFENRSQVAAAWLGSTLTSEDRYST